MTHQLSATERNTSVNTCLAAVATARGDSDVELSTVAAEVCQLLLSTLCRRRRRRKTTMRRLSEHRENRSIQNGAADRLERTRPVNEKDGDAGRRLGKLRPTGNSADAARRIPGRPMPPLVAIGPETFAAGTGPLSKTATAEIPRRG